MKRLAFAIARAAPASTRFDTTFPDVERINLNGLAILHGEPPDDLYAPSVETLCRYAKRLARFHEREPVLPLRFGTTFHNVDDLRNHVEPFAARWHQTLDEVDGCDELGLRVLLNVETGPQDLGPSEIETKPSKPANPGTAYFQKLQARHALGIEIARESSRMEARLRERLDAIARRVVVDPPGRRGDRILTMSFLVPRPRVPEFRDAFRQMTALDPGRLLLTGPWPPHAFSSNLLD